MNSVERVLHYCKLPQEADHFFAAGVPVEDTLGAAVVGDSWPKHGAIEVKDLSARYRPGLPLVLNGISFSVKAGEKVAICGRTGEGVMAAGRIPTRPTIVITLPPPSSQALASPV